MSVDNSKDYMFKMHNWELSEVEHFFKRIDLVDDVEKKLFLFLVENSVSFDSNCNEVDYALVLETVLTWASNPNNLRNYPHFPKGMEVLKNKYKPLLDKLVKIGLVTVSKNDTNGKTVIYLQPESNIKLTTYKIAFDKLLAAVRLSYREIRRGENELLKLESESFEILEELEFDVKLIESKRFNRSLLKLVQRQAVNISFKEDGLNIPVVLETVNDLHLMVEKVARKIFSEIINNHDEKVIIFHKRLDYLLIDLHRSKDPSIQLTFVDLFDLLNEEHGFYSYNYEAWTSLLWKMVSELPLGVDSGFSFLDRVVLQLLFGWISYDYDLKRKSKAGEKMLSLVGAKLASYQRVFSHEELFNIPAVVEYSKKYGEKNCNSIFTMFIAEKLFTEGVVSFEQSVFSFALSGSELFYFSGKLFSTIYRNLLSKAKDKKYGIKNICFYNGWGDKLAGNVYDEKVVKAMADDRDFFLYLDAIVKDREPHLHAIHQLLSDNPRLSIALCDADKVSLEFIFTVNGKIKPINVMLDIYRMQVIKKLRKEVSFFMKIVLKLKSLLHPKKSSSGMLSSIDRALQKNRLSQSRRRDDVGGQLDVVHLREQFVSKKDTPPVKAKKKIEKTEKAEELSPEKKLVVLKDKLLAGRSLDDILKEVRLPEGVSYEKSKSYIERVVAERISFVDKDLTPDTLEDISNSIATDPRLRKFIDKDILQNYVGVLVIDSLNRKSWEE